MARLPDSSISTSLIVKYLSPILVFMLMAAPMVHADGSVYLSSAGLGVDAYGEHSETTFDYNGVPVETRSNRIGLSVQEYYSPWLQPGLTIGYLDVSQNNNPVTNGMDLSGEFVGISLNADALQSESFDLNLGVSYTYNQAEDNLSSQSSKLQWHEVVTSIGTRYKLDALHLVAGGFVQTIDGDETANGVLTSTRNFGHDDSVGAYAGIDLLVPSGGRIVIRVDSGARDNVRISFQQSF